MVIPIQSPKSGVLVDQPAFRILSHNEKGSVGGCIAASENHDSNNTSRVKELNSNNQTRKNLHQFQSRSLPQTPQKVILQPFQ
eukprot:Pgem_evm1s7919